MDIIQRAVGVGGEINPKQLILLHHPMCNTWMNSKHKTLLHHAMLGKPQITNLILKCKSTMLKKKLLSDSNWQGTGTGMAAASLYIGGGSRGHQQCPPSLPESRAISCLLIL